MVVTELEKILAEKDALITAKQAEIEKILIKMGNGIASSVATILTIEQATTALRPFGQVMVDALDAYAELIPVMRRLARALGLSFRVNATQNSTLIALIGARRNKIRAITQEIAADLVRIAVENKVAGNASTAIIRELRNTLELAGRRAGTEVGTALSMFDRATMQNVYENAGIDRYVYFPPTLIETSRDSCKAVVSDPRNISGEGFTRREIDDMLDVDFIRGGYPYYNCRHEWIPAFGRVSTTRIENER